MTLLSLGSNGYKKLLKERKVCFPFRCKIILLTRTTLPVIGVFPFWFTRLMINMSYNPRGFILAWNHPGWFAVNYCPRVYPDSLRTLGQLIVLCLFFIFLFFEKLLHQGFFLVQ